MSMILKSFYWSEHRRHCLEVLKYEFQHICVVEDMSYRNDQSPSILLTFENKKFHVFLPSEYTGTYTTFKLFDVTDKADVSEGIYIGDYLNLEYLIIKIAQRIF